MHRSVPHPTMLHSEQKCAHFCSETEWSIVGCGTGAFWDLWYTDLYRPCLTAIRLWLCSSLCWDWPSLPCHCLLLAYCWKPNHCSQVLYWRLHNTTQYGFHCGTCDPFNIETLFPVNENGIHIIQTSNGFWCIGIKGEMSGTVCVTFTWDIYIYMSCL